MAVRGSTHRRPSRRPDKTLTDRSVTAFWIDSREHSKKQVLVRHDCHRLRVRIVGAQQGATNVSMDADGSGSCPRAAWYDFGGGTVHGDRSGNGHRLAECDLARCDG